MPLETVHDLTRIDRWFLSKMRRIARLRAAMEGMADVGDLDLRALRKVKQAGFSDDQVAHYTNCADSECELSFNLGRQPPRRRRCGPYESPTSSVILHRPAR